MAKNETASNSLQKIKEHPVLRQLFFIAAGFVLFLIAVQIWLRIYTHHGQKIELPKFIGMPLAEAEAIAEDNDFEIIVNDSVFIVGKSGGIITEQNPKPASLVKEKRKIYVTVTKYGTETIKVKDLPILYGNAYEQKKTELSYRDINAKIKDYAYDPGEPDHILEVWYDGRKIIDADIVLEDIEIAKGGTLEFVVSKSEGGDVLVPDVRCLDLEEARFVLETAKLEVGDISYKGAGGNTVFVVSQSPPHDGTTILKMGEKVSLTVSSVKPANCN